MKNLLKKCQSLNVKFGIITFFTYMLLVTVILLGCYNHFFHNMIKTYVSIGNEILNSASDDIDIDHIPDYLSGDYDPKEYDATQAKLDRYVDYYQEIYYLYAFKINPGSEVATIIFDSQTDHDGVQLLGDDYELEHDFVSNMEKLEKGESIDPLMDNTEWGYLLTCSKPLIGSDGECKGYLLVDFNLTETKEKDRLFILRLFVVVFFFTLAVLFFAMKAVSRRITGPIEKMHHCLDSFRFETNDDRQENLERLRELDIKTNPEIQSLYEALLSSTLESYTYQQEYQVATEKLGEASEMAYKDSLTGAENKNAYENQLKELQEKVDNGTTEMSVIMVDVNNLKYVNDTYGHSKGDAYIIGCCDVIRRHCGNSHIYRIGGDEFAVFLYGKEHANRRSIYAHIVSDYEYAFEDENSQPWDRYSAAVGMADYIDTDESIADVVKRADSAMYQSKSEFKKKYGSYR